jgi:hypothetical protein
MTVLSTSSTVLDDTSPTLSNGNLSLGTLSLDYFLSYSSFF